MARLLTVHYDPESCEVTRIEFAAVVKADALMRADLLQDALCDLTAIYNAAVDELCGVNEKLDGDA